jgi:hypothetical protein
MCSHFLEHLVDGLSSMLFDFHRGSSMNVAFPSLCRFVQAGKMKALMFQKIDLLQIYGRVMPTKTGSMATEARP